MYWNQFRPWIASCFAFIWKSNGTHSYLIHVYWLLFFGRPRLVHLLSVHAVAYLIRHREFAQPHRGQDMARRMLLKYVNAVRSGILFIYLQLIDRWWVFACLRGRIEWMRWIGWWVADGIDGFFGLITYTMLCMMWLWLVLFCYIDIRLLRAEQYLPWAFDSSDVNGILCFLLSWYWALPKSRCRLSAPWLKQPNILNIHNRSLPHIALWLYRLGMFIVFKVQ